MKTRIPPVSIMFALVCSALVQNAQGVSPAPDGGYPGGNTAEGQRALLSLTNGGFNTAVGFLSLSSNNTGSFNTGVGAGALLVTFGDKNTATGAGALLSNSNGGSNTATGAFALFNNTTGERNNAFGVNALFSHIAGTANNAVGVSALYSDIGGQSNNAFGDSALVSNTIGNSNTGIGDGALSFNTTGNNNTAIGYAALLLSTGSNNVAVGFNAGGNVSTADNVICIGSPGADFSNSSWVGNVYGVTTQSGTTAPVIVSDSGQLGTIASSERFKKDISPMEKASEAIWSLRPVSFHYKSDVKNTPQFGLIAEEVAKVDTSLILPDKEGRPYTVRYDAINAMLLNEFLKEHGKVEEQNRKICEQDRTITQLKKEMETVIAHLSEHDSKFERVSNQLEMSRPGPQVVRIP